MNVIKTINKLCLSCMEVHDVMIVEVIEQNIFKNEEVKYTATYEYCSETEEYSETEEMIKLNDLSFKDAYRQKVNLLTSKEIIAIRDSYKVSQKDFSEILGWGQATITRYENYQVQDVAHDDILRKISSDPKWFMEMLKRAKDNLSEKAYLKYCNEANEHFKRNKNQYIIDSIYAIYADYTDKVVTGNVNLSISKVIELINYLAKKVEKLHKVKLMKMLWYSDVLNYKRYQKSITGLAYSALPMGAVPEGYEQIVLLEGVIFDTVFYEENVAYKFKPNPKIEITHLTPCEIETIDTIINELGRLTTDQIVHKMHEEDAYKYTRSNEIISYSYAEALSIS